jgi:hypothetical protein
MMAAQSLRYAVFFITHCDGGAKSITVLPGRAMALLIIRWIPSEETSGSLV